MLSRARANSNSVLRPVDHHHYLGSLRVASALDSSFTTQQSRYSVLHLQGGAELCYIPKRRLNTLSQGSRNPNSTVAWLKRSRSFASSSSLRDQPKDATTGFGAEGAGPFPIPPQLPSSIVSNYWDDVMRSASEPGFVLAPDCEESSKMSSEGRESYGIAGWNLTSADSSSFRTAPDESQIRKLLSAAVRARREGGDLYPSLLARQSCEFYDSLSMANFGKLP
ncbi:hypothetical protein BC829DRAFT_382339 [Chytridium lagenaria]|nr:hypothetical protein BC829DRAFT_382339 [Chytridium lagenaria]